MDLFDNMPYMIFRLTAFVLKSFVQAKPYIFIDDGAVHKMVDWIVKYQNSNGSVWEPGRVIHKNMQVNISGKGHYEYGKTSKICISLFPITRKFKIYLLDTLDSVTRTYS